MTAPSAARSVLLVEDEAGLAETIALNLEAVGLQVECIGDDLSALGRLEATPPDAVILDLGLPRVSGQRVMRVLRRTAGWEATPVVVLTALNFEEAQDVIRTGVDEFIPKPFEMTDMVDRVLTLIERRG
jgi:DNA-binding response OmpR family regulator